MGTCSLMIDNDKWYTLMQLKWKYCNLLMTRYDFIFEVDMNYFILGVGRGHE